MPFFKNFATMVKQEESLKLLVASMALLSAVRENFLCIFLKSFGMSKEVDDVFKS